MSEFPEAVLARIGSHLNAMDRMRLHATCRRFREIYSKWKDIVAIEIRSETYGYTENIAGSRVAFQFPITKVPKSTFRVKLTDAHGRVCRLRTMQDKSSAKSLKTLMARIPCIRELTIWEACLTSEFASVISKLESTEVLRLWNCSRYFEKKNHSAKLINTLFALPAIKSLLILDSTNASSSNQSCRAGLSKSLALRIRAPIENLQLTGLHIPLKTMEILSHSLAPTLRRLAMGCTFGKESKRPQFIKAIQNFSLLNDLDLPPFIFHLSDLPVADGMIQKLLETLPLKALGFRHYNSSVLFHWIEYQLPMKVRVLRVHHNGNRVPNFAQLGQLPEEDFAAAKKKSSVSSRYSILSASRSSIGSAEMAQSMANGSSSTNGHSGSLSDREMTQATAKLAQASILSDRKDSITSTLALRRLTIFAIEERTKRRAQRIRRRNYSGVDVIYTQESHAGQEVLGRMANPMRSPHVYTKNNKREVRIIKGDLVRPIPLSSLGMESDYELELDWDE